MPERRQAPRFEVRVRAALSQGRRDASGVLVGVSQTGAEIGDTSFTPTLTERVHVYVLAEAEPIELVGSVVRLSPRGFAIEFDRLGDAAKQWLADFATAQRHTSASVPPPRRRGGRDD